MHIRLKGVWPSLDVQPAMGIFVSHVMSTGTGGDNGNEHH